VTVPLSAKQLVNRLWSYCHVLRHDGVSTIDYVDQLTLLLFLKMADERAERGLGRERIVPEGLDWQVLLRSRADDLEDRYTWRTSTTASSWSWASGPAPSGGSSRSRRTRSGTRPRCAS
jgi:hypothetical protein